MPKTYVITDIAASPPRDLNFVTGVWEALGARIKKMEEGDGTISVIAVMPDETPEIEFPATGSNEFAWMNIARAEMGVKEVLGTANNPRVEEYHATTSGNSDADSIPWCSSFVNFCITEAKLTGTNSRRARSWANWGRDAGVLTVGCIVVLSRTNDPAKGHVGFFVGMDGSKRIHLLGGNQSNAVNISSFDAARLVAQRLPG